MAKSLEDLKKDLAYCKQLLNQYRDAFMEDGTIDDAEQAYLNKMIDFTKTIEKKIKAIEEKKAHKTKQYTDDDIYDDDENKKLKLKVYVSYHDKPREKVWIGIVKGPMTRPKIKDGKPKVKDEK
ncbi:MAG: hypothetical protein MK207_15520, partial [Saprospiraceae bacterium]|nr:hypothetical protein [Saprospiraceae bacterium]